MPGTEAILGSWRMISWTRTSADTGAVVHPLGPDPIGYIAYHADGRMMATVFRRDRPGAKGGTWTDDEKTGLYDSMLAYVATYTVEDNRVVHHVEAAWDPNWQFDLSRPFTLTGDTLVIAGAPGVDPETGKAVIYRMEFRKV